MRRLAPFLFLTALAAAQAPPAPESPDTRKRIDLNLLGAADTEAGESRRNENIQFNLVDNNALKELNIRLGVSATIVSEFDPARRYFGAEFGNSPAPPVHLTGAPKQGVHGTLRYAHLNSVFSARTFFQAGSVRPAHENDYGFALAAPLWRGAHLSLDFGQQKIRGNVNGNVLVPRADERTPLATDPATRAIVERFLDAYPRELPNRTDVNPRALNTNSPQIINSDNAAVRLDQSLGARDRLLARYAFTLQSVDAFQLVAGQNPDTTTRSHLGRLTWVRAVTPASTLELTAAFDRLGSLLVPEPNAVGPMVSTGGLETLGPQAIIPINRAQNIYRTAGQFRAVRGNHAWTTGASITRRQLNGVETDAHRGFFGFGNDFGNDAITNLRLGLPNQYIVSLGDVHRGFRHWEGALYAGDVWRVTPAFTVQYSLRWELIGTPAEVNNRNAIPYRCDCNNLAPALGLARRFGGRWGVARAAGAVQFGEIFPVTWQQVRFSPPGSVKIAVPAPDLRNPLANAANAKGNLYQLDPNLVAPYSYQYNASWEPELWKSWRLQFGYAGSRSHKLLIMWYLNRAHPVDGIPQTTATINQRRADSRIAENRFVLNGSSGYFDAARATLIVPGWHGLNVQASYWFSKAIDLGASYTNTAYDADSRLSRSQSEFETQRDMKSLSSFDQPHAFLWRATYAIPIRPARGWSVSAVILLKKGTPFTVVSGSDGPGYGNVDGNGNDRPNLLDPTILGRTIGNPDDSRRLLPRSAFAYIAPTDAQGSLGRATFRKGPIRNVNAALFREWRLPRETRLTFRAESVNLLNTPQFAEPGVELANGNFGQITNTLNEGRTFRFGLQLGW